MDIQTPEKQTIIERDINKNSQPVEFDQSQILNSVFHRGPRKRSGLKLTSWMIMSVIVDHLMIIFNCCLFLISASLLLKVMDPHYSMAQLIKPFLSKNNLISTWGFLYILISLIYFVGFRVLIGATIGEWSCGIRVGQPYERLQTGYKMKIISRVFLILGTGIITVPLLSLLLKKDIAGQLTRASLYTLR